MRAPRFSRDLIEKDREMSQDILYVSELKALAKTLRQTRGISHSCALEEIAHQFKYRDWNTLVAAAGPQPPVRAGRQVSGLYLNVPFSGRVLWVKSAGEGLFRVNIHFDDLIDVVPFESFSNIKNRANKVVNVKGVSIDKTTNGLPHLVLNL